MSKLILLIITLFSFNANAIEGKMSCTVKKQVVYKLIDGQVTEFSGFKDSFEVGDSFQLKYELDDNKLDFRMVGVERLLWSTFDLDRSQIYEIIEEINIAEVPYLGGNEVSISKNLIRFGKLYKLSTFRRYYKDDWMGITIYQNSLDGSSISNHTVFWDCKHITDSKIDKIYNRLKKLI